MDYSDFFSFKKPEPEILSPKTKSILRVGSYFTLIYLFIKYGHILEMPENPNYS